MFVTECFHNKCFKLSTLCSVYIPLGVRVGYDIVSHDIIKPKLTSNFTIYPANIKISTINVQSIKGKDLILRNYIDTNKIDLCVMSETWLTSQDSDKIWYESTTLNNDGLKISTANRKDRQGGGLALIHKAHITTKLLQKAHLMTFEFAKWEVKTAGACCNLIGIDHHTVRRTQTLLHLLLMNLLTGWLIR